MWSQCQIMQKADFNAHIHIFNKLTIQLNKKMKNTIIYSVLFQISKLATFKVEYLSHLIYYH